MMSIIALNRQMLRDFDEPATSPRAGHHENGFEIPPPIEFTSVS
jgi:hypothetical protein